MRMCAIVSRSNKNLHQSCADPRGSLENVVEAVDFWVRSEDLESEISVLSVWLDEDEDDDNNNDYDDDIWLVSE